MIVPRSPHAGARADAPGRLVMLLGSPRSGTTWFASILNTHPGVLYCHEPISKPRDARHREIIRRMRATGTLDDRERRELWESWRGSGAEYRRPPFFRKDFQRVPPWAVKASWAVARSTGLGDRLFRRVAAPRGGRRFDILVKEVGWAKHAPAVVGALGPEKLIVIVRHPCAVVESILRGKRHGYMPGAGDRDDLLGGFASECRAVGVSPRDIENMNEYQLHALVWVLQNAAYLGAARSLGEGVVHFADYEAICGDPLAETGRAFGFLGWDVGPQTIAFIESSTREKRSPGFFQGKRGYFGVYRDPLVAATAWRDRISEAAARQILEVAELLPASCNRLRSHPQFRYHTR